MLNYTETNKVAPVSDSERVSKRTRKDVILGRLAKKRAAKLTTNNKHSWADYSNVDVLATVRAHYASDAPHIRQDLINIASAPLDEFETRIALRKVQVRFRRQVSLRELEKEFERIKRNLGGAL